MRSLKSSLKKINYREVKQIKSKNLECHALPEIIDIIKKSKAVTTGKGKSHFLLRLVIQKKAKKQFRLEEEKEKEVEQYRNEL